MILKLDLLTMTTLEMFSNQTNDFSKRQIIKWTNEWKNLNQAYCMQCQQTFNMGCFNLSKVCELSKISRIENHDSGLPLVQMHSSLNLKTECKHVYNLHKCNNSCGCCYRNFNAVSRVQPHQQTCATPTSQPWLWQSTMWWTPTRTSWKTKAVSLSHYYLNPIN